MKSTSVNAGRTVILLSLIFFFNSALLQAQSFITVYAPYASQVTYRNTPVDIQWYAYLADTVNLQYSIDSGATWTAIVNNYVGSDYVWTTPNVVTQLGMIRVTASADSTVFAETGPFVISDIPTIHLVKPNGGEIWNYNNNETVEWTGTDLPSILYYDYSIDSGATWSFMGTAYGNVVHGTAVANPPPITSSNVLLKIYDPNYPTLFTDVSDQPFTINTPPVMIHAPTAGSEFYIGQDVYVEFEITDNQISQLNLELSIDNGVTWQHVAQNINATASIYAWTATGVPSQTCKLRISDDANAAKFAISETFALLPTPVIRLLSPTGGEVLNTTDTFAIAWEHSDPHFSYLNLEYSIDSGQNWNYIYFADDTATQGSFLWITPDTESTECLIRITDYDRDFVSDTSNVFSILTYPVTSLCMVTVDSATNRNVIAWEKPVSPLIDKFIIYRESDVAGVYDSIGDLNYNDFSAFSDLSSDAAIKSYRYKLGYTDSAEHVFPVGALHQSIHLSIDQGVGTTWDLTWTNYIGFSYTSYNIYRGSSATNMSLIDSIASNVNSYTDPNAPAGEVYYMVEVVNPDGCSPAFKAGDYNSSRSNIVTGNSVGINDINEVLGSIYPNPANDKISLNFSAAVLQTPLTIELRDMLGKVVYADASARAQKNNSYFIEVGNLHQGIYLLTIATGEKIMSKKVVVQHL